MPIKPENAARYPRDWPAISASIRERAGHRCEWRDGETRCRACQYAVGHWARGPDGLWLWQPVQGNVEADDAGQGRGWPDGQRWAHSNARAYAADCIVCVDGVWQRPIVIVLTVMHLDHTPENCDPSNLLAACQRHHLAYDHAHHQANAQATRRARAGQPELF